jgi:putative ABC transport system substrate-binding protein
MKRREFIGLLGGAAAAWPVLAQAQRAGKIPRVGHLWHAGNAEDEAPYFKALIEGFERLGYVHGRNITLEHRFPNEMPDRFRSMAAELVSLNCDVLMSGAVGTTYLREATAKIPIVFMFVADPIGLKLVDSFARPGGNVTGLSSFGRDLAAKRLQYLKEAVPALSRVALLVNSNPQSSRVFVEEFDAVAPGLGLTVQPFEARSPAELEPAFEAMTKAGVQALVTAAGGTVFLWRAQIATLAIAHRLAHCAYSKETFEDGALMSYGPDLVEMCRYSAVYADKILKGAAPADLPVEQPSKLKFFVNLKTANTPGLTIPPTLLALADEVIE